MRAWTLVVAACLVVATGCAQPRTPRRPGDAHVDHTALVTHISAQHHRHAHRRPPWTTVTCALPRHHEVRIDDDSSFVSAQAPQIEPDAPVARGPPRE
jgi:hypothetical protein